MKKTHVIRDKATGLYFKEVHPGVHQAVEGEEYADFYTANDAATIFLEARAKDPTADYEIKEGSVTGYMRWLGRKSAKVMTPAKRKAQAKRARGRKSKKLHWTWSKNKPKSAPTI